MQNGLKESSKHFYRNADSFRKKINWDNCENSNLYILYQGTYFLQIIKL